MLSYQTIVNMKKWVNSHGNLYSYLYMQSCDISGTSAPFAQSGINPIRYLTLCKTTKLMNHSKHLLIKNFKL